MTLLARLRSVERFRSFANEEVETLFVCVTAHMAFTERIISRPQVPPRRQKIYLVDTSGPTINSEQSNQHRSTPNIKLTTAPTLLRINVILAVAVNSPHFRIDGPIVSWDHSFVRVGHSVRRIATWTQISYFSVFFLLI